MSQEYITVRENDYCASEHVPFTVTTNWVSAVKIFTNQ